MCFGSRFVHTFLLPRLVIVTLSIVLGSLIISEAVLLWSSQPTVFEVSDLHYKVSEHRDVPFPALTICPIQETEVYNLPEIMLNRYY